MPDVPTALPDTVKIRALTRERGYRIKDIARKIGCPESSIYDLTGRKVPLPRSVALLRQLAAVLSTPKRPVKVSDISDWDGDDDIESEPEPKVPAA
jgi:hypothetical protein